MCNAHHRHSSLHALHSADNLFRQEGQGCSRRLFRNVRRPPRRLVGSHWLVCPQLCVIFIMCSFPYFRFLLHRGVGFLQPDQCFTVERTLEKEFFKFRVSPPQETGNPKPQKNPTLNSQNLPNRETHSSRSGRLITHLPSPCRNDGGLQ